MPEIVAELGDDDSGDNYGCGAGEIYFIYGYGDRGTSGRGMLEIKNYHQEHDDANDYGVFGYGREMDAVECRSANESNDVAA